MTNREYYKNKILDIACDGYLVAFDNRTNELVECGNLPCRYCKFSQGKCAESIRNWMTEEHEELQVDWSKVAVDTPILVSNFSNAEEWEWQKRYFAKYEGGKVYAFTNGATSWSANMSVDWEYAKLYDKGEMLNG